jgi:hypothetical protein
MAGPRLQRRWTPALEMVGAVVAVLVLIILVTARTRGHPGRELDVIPSGDTGRTTVSWIEAPDLMVP